MGFRGYFNASTRAALLQSTLEQPAFRATWHEVERNAAIKHSDFSVVRILPTLQADAVRALRANPMVRYVAAQHRIREGLNGATPPDFYEGPDVSAQTEKAPTVVSTKLGAYAQWSKGYTGAGVKVVVFDTG